MNATEITAILTAAGVLIAAVVAWRRYGPETVNMNVNAANVNVSTSMELMDRLEKEVKRLSDEMDDLRRELHVALDERDRYKVSSEAWKSKAEESEAEVLTLKRRVVTLEAKVSQLENGARQ